MKRFFQFKDRWFGKNAGQITPKDFKGSAQTLENLGIGDEGVAYTDSMEHLTDELKRLDLMIQLSLTHLQSHSSDGSLKHLQGLVISDEEVSALLARSPGTNAGDKPKNSLSRKLEDALNAMEKRIDARRSASQEAGINLALLQITQIFQLGLLEEQCLLICLAPELDLKYEKLYAYIQDDVTRKRPTIDLVLNLLCKSPEEKVARRLIFEPQAPLLKFKLVQLIDNAAEAPLPLLAQSLKLDDRIVSFLFELQTKDRRLESWTRLVYPGDETNFKDVPNWLAGKTQEFIHCNFTESGAPQRKVVFHLYGPKGVGKRTVAAATAKELGLPLLVGNLEHVFAQSIPVDAQLWLLARESFLQPAVLCVENLDLLLGEGKDDRSAEFRTLFEAIELFSQVTFLLSSSDLSPHKRFKNSVFISQHLPIPYDADRVKLWQSHAHSYRFDDEVDYGTVGSQFRFTSGQICDALSSAQDMALWRSPRDEAVSMQELYAACRAQSDPKLIELTRKIEPRYQWNDIVLPTNAHEQLLEICSQARNRHIVFGEWGFDRKLSLGKGLSALFSGPPGTGKTMGAEVIASELGLDLYKIDLSQVISKYIGETEKNLRRIFDAAEHANAILFFDEADALFGKRSEVRDSHDRYANVEISYLLQKMEEYEGVSILATNLRKHMDEAFVRRLQFIVEFPFPDAECRERIWCVTFPKETPVDDDVDQKILAEEIRLAGGSIKNIALGAAFYAAGDGGIIRMSHLMQAARREHQKLGRVWSHKNLPQAEKVA